VASSRLRRALGRRAVAVLVELRVEREEANAADLGMK
jgi:hypothetical protein